MKTNLTILLEKFASDTWKKIRLGYLYSCSQIETTITDNHLLEFSIANVNNLRIYKAKGLDEPKKGFDWEWWVGSYNRGYYRYSIQAKLLHYADNKYYSLRYAVKGTQQIDILESFSKSQNSIPLYCFYNSRPININNSTSWHCNLPYDTEQLGCTLVPIDHVKKYIQKRSTRTFESLHSTIDAIPWRCIVTCPSFFPRKNLINQLSPKNREVRLVMELPDFLKKRNKEDEKYTIELPDKYYDSDLGGKPKNILVFELEN
ncbi:hypothetical protein [Leptospira perdikensis]|nr:hypothetical protein [Leptospira perdikensis]